MFENDDDYKKICKQLKYNFQNKKLLEQALVRKSACQENRQPTNIGHNEQLEFFGDSILRSVIDDCLIDQFPEYSEEQLSG